MVFRMLPAALLGPTLAVLALAAGPWSVPARAQDRKDGLFVTVPNPITDDAVRVIELKVQDAVVRQKRPIATVVFDFNPQSLPAGTAKWNSCNALAEYILNLQRGQVKGLPRLTTIAFVQAAVTKHTVLPVLACKQIVMSDAIDTNTRLPRARLGDVTRDLDGIFTQAMKSAYTEVAKHFPSPELVERMIDRDLLLRKIKTPEGPRYVTDATIEKLRKSDREFRVDGDVPEFLLPGNASFEPGPLSDPLLGLGMVSGIKNSRIELADSLGLPRSSVVEDWLVGRTKVIWRIEVRNPLDRGKIESLERKINQAVRHDANFIILHLDVDGGDTTNIASLAQHLRGLKDQTGLPVKTLAYVPPSRSLGAATFLALGCNEIVMARDSVLADFSTLNPERVNTVRDMLLPLVKEQGYPPLLFEAALSKDLVLYRVKEAANPERQTLITEQEFQKDAAGKDPRWLSFGRIDRAAGEMLKIPASLAGELGIALATNVNSLDELHAMYGLDPLKVRVARDDWLDAVAEFFREPWVNFLLIMLGIAGLILEMKMPGTTIPGVIAALCFVLFFWSYSFVGEFTLLAVLLFILGLILIGAEVFVLPGVIFPGIAGIVLVISSLVVVTLDRMPQTAQDWSSLAATLGTFGLSLVAALAAAVMLAWYLPSLPYASRLILDPPSDEAGDEATIGSISGAHPSLLGAIGLAATPLRPAGKAQFGDDFLDVIAEGDFVPTGARVQIIEIEGNRIVVKSV